MTEVVIRSSRQTPLREVLSLPALIADLVHYRELLLQFAGRDLESRHKGTMLGAAWTIVSPLLTLLTYTFLFSVVFQMKWGQLETASAHGEFALTFFCGYVVFGIFQDCANKAPGLVIDRPNLVRKVIFPLEVLPASALISALVYAAVGVGLVLIWSIIATGSISTTAWLFPVVLIPMCMFTLGVGWFLAALGVFIRDSRQVVTVLVQLTFFATPIFYPVERVPENYRFILEANPFTPIIEMSRQTLLWSQVPSWSTLALLMLGGLVIMQAGYAFFMRSKGGFADVI